MITMMNNMKQIKFLFCLVLFLHGFPSHYCNFSYYKIIVSILLLVLKKKKYPLGMISLLFLVLIILSIIIIVEFIYYMDVSEEYTNSLEKLQENL